MLEVRHCQAPGESTLIGALGEEGRRVYFQYDSTYLAGGVSLSPFKLPIRAGLIEHADQAFGPLPGLFDDSLPDGWGRLLMDRHLRRQGLDPDKFSPLDRLAYLGTRTMGALTYHPPEQPERDAQALDLHALGQNAQEVLAGETAEILPRLLQAGGSPGGARPKVLVGVQGERLVSGEGDLPAGFEAWMVKFPARTDARDAGPIEHAYALMAKAAGIEMPDTRIFEAKQGQDTQHYFGVKRFDRGDKNRRTHVHTFANMIHANFRIPSSDYADLLKVTRGLTRSHADVLRVFRQMVFNVAAHNRDDHAKNFAFLLDSEANWTLTPAYDLTLSPGPGGEHSMSIAGEGRRPTRRDCLTLAAPAGIQTDEAAAIFEQVNQAIARWPEFAHQAHCAKRAADAVSAALTSI